MGDVRFDEVHERVKHAKDRRGTIGTLSDEDVIAALGGAVHDHDPLLANVLATEAQNRSHRANAIASAVGEGVIAMDRDWLIASVNPAAERLLGWAPGQMRGQDLHALVHPFCNVPQDCHLGSLPPAEFFYQNDDALVMREDGRTIRVAYTVTPMVRTDEVEGGVVVLRDSSERKRQEEKTTLRQDRLLAILGSLAEGVLMMNMNGRITYANLAAERILGRPTRDIMERTYYDPVWNYETLDGKILRVDQLPFMRAIDTGEPVRDSELAIRRGDDSVVFVNLNTVPLRDANDAPYAVLVSFLDMGRFRAKEKVGVEAAPKAAPGDERNLEHVPRQGKGPKPPSELADAKIGRPDQV